jgi:hypothetical protein
MDESSIAFPTTKCDFIKYLFIHSLISIGRNRLRPAKVEMNTILPVDLETSSGIIPGIPVKSLIFGF